MWPFQNIYIFQECGLKARYILRYLKVGPRYKENNGALHNPKLEFEDELQKYHLIFKDQVPTSTKLREIFGSNLCVPDRSIHELKEKKIFVCI